MRIMLAIILNLIGSAALANDLPPIPLDRQTREADLIIIGRLGREVPCRMDIDATDCVEINVEAILKGQTGILGQRYYLRRSFGTGEEYVASVIIPGRALIFLRRVDTEVYVPLHGDRSILSVF